MSDLQASILAALDGRYALDHVVGRGGMSTVYLARDRKHDRLVALKFLDPDLGRSLGADRFFREIRLTARLQHPHILPLIDSDRLLITGPDDRSGPQELLYYVMPYVTGGSLRGRLARQGPLPIESALRLGREIADALDYAHREGVVHRDIKPENILLSEGHALVADFGIATAVETGTVRQTPTAPGVAVGSMGYMSPEQATADPNIDGRSDVYSLGLVLYEMLAGAPPYAGIDIPTILARQLTEPAPSVRAVRPEVPGPIDAAIARALACTAAGRFATAGELSTELDSGLAALVGGRG